MKNVIKKIINGEEIEQIINQLIQSLYMNGPVLLSDLEILCYLKIYQEDDFSKIEQKVLKYMGLYYKELSTESLTEIIFNMYQEYISDKYEELYTPVQAKIVEGITENKCFSFSAPTSTGKSHVFRKIIEKSEKDIVIVVPSRALINEYYNRLREHIIDKSINILTFVDRINIRHAKRSIFILTPERCKDLFKFKNDFNIEYIFFDEAQLGNDENFRGLYFDSIIRRSQKAFSDVKFIFAHPFIENPQAQVEKNKFNKENSDSEAFKLRNVGQIFYTINKDGEFSHFGIDKTIMGKRKIDINFDPIENVLKRECGSVLIYTSKASIISGKILKLFKNYLELCPEVSDSRASNIIEKIASLIGASTNKDDERYSEMVALLERGIVMHHGSLPLEVRTLVEEFTSNGFCKICFATSTLEQGINMPFDLVYLATFPASNPLGIKNLIGRAGRSTLKPHFDFGEVVINSGNMPQFRKIMSNNTRLDSTSLLDKELPESLEDLEEFKESILDGTFSDDYNMTPKQLEDLGSLNSQVLARNLLDYLIIDSSFKSLKDIKSRYVAEIFRKLYSIYLRRTLSSGEEAVIDTAVQIMLWKIYGKKFKDICYFRYAYISRIEERKERDYKNIKLAAKPVMPYSEIPNRTLKFYPLFPKNTQATAVRYDSIVYDTYDYLDKVISFRLTDIFVAVFENYWKSTNDERAKNMVNYIRYGTNDSTEIWLLRYGFTFEDIEWIKPYVTNIDENEIKFNPSIFLEEDKNTDIIERFYHKEDTDRW